MYKRSSGILFPVFSLPGKFGIGSFSKEAYDFVDFLKGAGQTYWQVLPLGQTGFGDSPYQPVSAFAGNPYFVNLETLIDDELLSWEECEKYSFGDDQTRVNYEAQYNNRTKLLRLAFDRFAERLKKDGTDIYDPDFLDLDNDDQTVMSEEATDKTAGKVFEDEEELPEDQDFKIFIRENQRWLIDYALYMALKKKNEGKSWLDWPEKEKSRDPKTMETCRHELQEDIYFFFFVQWKFFRQWDRLHAYSNEQGVKIIGDMPFYLSMDSADTWAHPEVFRFSADLEPQYIAGCPPDAFSATGQLWGNPVYNWEYERKNHYSWWIERMRETSKMFDVVRIDHFHGFAEYYEIPYGDSTAENGKMKKGPGMGFFRELKRELGDMPIIAEDLGTITPENAKLLEESGYPGMKVLQYAFDGSESSWYLPYNHIRNSVVYTGTHDNATLLEWIQEASDHDRDFARRYIHSEDTNYGAFVWDMIREAYRSVSELCIVPLQDYLVKGREARINTPGTQGENWKWRLEPDFLSEDLKKSIYELAKLYGRLPEKDSENF